MPTAAIRGVSIHYEVFGGNGPWFAFVTGGRRGYAEFVPLANKLAAEGCRVLLHDRRNTGASEVRIAGDEGEEEIWADDLVLLLGQLGALPAFVGGTSSGARMSMLVYLRHPQAVRGLILARITGGAFAAGRLPGMYYGQFIDAAHKGGMAAVCATEQYQERIAANPANRDILMAMDPQDYVRVMQHWLEIFLRGPRAPVMGLTDAQLASIRVPTLIVPGNDNTHASVNGRAAAQLIPGSELFELPIEDQDVPLLPFSDWAPHEPALARKFVEFMRRVDGACQQDSGGSMFVQANGIRTHYVLDGPADAPWVTFVTGIANDTTLFEGQARALADRFRVLRYDLRGQGRSAATAGDYSIELLAADLVALWDALGVRRSHLVGLGLGGPVVMRVAIDHPERIDRLLPTCCRARMVPEFAAMWHKLVETVTAGGVEPIVEQTAQRWFSEQFKAANPEVLDGVRAMIRATSKEGYLGVVGAFLKLDLEDDLGRIRAPTLFIGGAEDKIGGPEVLMRALAARVPGAAYAAVPEAAHIANVQNAAGFNRIVRDFLLA